MEKHQIIKALYGAKTLYHQYGEHMLERSRLSSLEVQKVLAEFEAMKLAESQHQ